MISRFASPHILILEHTLSHLIKSVAEHFMSTLENRFPSVLYSFDTIKQNNSKRLKIIAEKYIEKCIAGLSVTDRM